MLLLLHPHGSWPRAWQDEAQHQRWLQLTDVSGVSIVDTEVKYLREQFAQVDTVLQSGDMTHTCGSCDNKLDCAALGHSH